VQARFTGILAAPAATSWRRPRGDYAHTSVYRLSQSNIEENPMDLSVVIPCMNAADVIGEQLAALSRQKWHRSWEVIVADNGSTDGTAAVVEKHKESLPQLRWVDASGKRGAAHARNAGVAAAQGNLIAFCDADDEVGTGWLAAMGAALDRHPFVAARIDIAKLNPPEIAGAVRSPQWDGLQRVEYPPHLSHASGASLGITRAAHEAVAGFDEELPYLEDTDYCFRLQLNGVALRFLPEAMVHYRFKDRQKTLFNQARHWGEYNVLMYKRYRQDMRLANPWTRHLSRWRALLRRSPHLLEQQNRLAWMKTLGTQVGVLQGSLRFRVAPIAVWLLLCSLAKTAELSPLLLHH
jgi:GT2 family glycosyltransferase